MTEPIPVVLGNDLGGTKLLGMLVGPDGEPLADRKVPTPDGDVDALVAALRALADGLLADVGGDAAASLSAVGLGAPGLVDRNGVLRIGANLPGIVDGNLADALAAEFAVSVAVDNDATCAAWAEATRGAARGAESSITVTLGTGIGAGLVLEGALVRGANGFAGEPGHMIVDPNGPACPCGQRGCWERYASGSGLAHLARTAVAAGNGDRLLEHAGVDADHLRGEAVTAAAAAGLDEAIAVMDRFAWWVALGVANLVNLFDPQVVVLGGGLAEAQDLYLDRVRSHYAQLVYGGTHRPTVEIKGAELGPRAGAWGAALLAQARTEA